MNAISRFGEFGRTLWSQLSTQSRIGLVIASLFCVAIIVGVGYWSSQPNYVPLTEHIGAIKAAEVKERLDAANIQNKLSYAGNSVLVNQKSFSEAKIAIADIVQSGDIPDPSPWGGMLEPNGGRAASIRQKEAELSAKLAKLKFVNSAAVTLATPKSSPFIRNRIEPSASVLLTMEAQISLTRKLATSVATIVASGVEGLQIKNVKVIDQHGQHYSIGDDDSGFAMGEQNEIRRTREEELAGKAIQQLEAALGNRMAEVSVTAEFDFDYSDTTKTILDPDQKVVTSETQIVTESNSEPGKGGVAGVTSNLGSPQSKKNDLLHKSEEITSAWDHGQEIRKEIKPGGNLTRISVSVVAELPSVSIPNEAGETNEDNVTPTDANELQTAKLEEIVKSAVGFDEARGDRFEILFTSMAGKEDLSSLWSEETNVLSPFWMDIIKNSSLGVAALVAFVVAVLLIRRITPITVRDGKQQGLSPERTRQISDMASLVRENPDLLSRIVAAWSNNAGMEGDKSSSNNVTRNKAA